MRTIFFLVFACFLSLGWTPKDFDKKTKQSGGSTKSSGGSTKKSGGDKKNNGGDKKNNGGDKKNQEKPTTYYFSSDYGNDSRTSIEAQNPSTPWKTIAKLNSFFSNLHPGDAVLFRRGETFYGTINIGQSGSASSPIVIGAYGTGDKPIITSLVTLSEWKANSRYKGVYDCAVNSELGTEVNMVLLNGIFQQVGRYPNSNAVNKGYLTFESHQGASSITDKELPSYPNWTGAEVVIRTSHWIIDKSVIQSHSNNEIFFSPKDITAQLRDGYGYFIQNSLKTLDQFGEWYYNPATKVVSMYFGSKKPSSYHIEASAMNNTIYSRRKSYIVLDNLTFKGANKYAVNIIRGSNIIVKNCKILFSGIGGVRVSGHESFLIENCTILNSNNTGIAAGGTNNNAIVRNNIIKNTYSIVGMGRPGNGQGSGIRIGKNGLAEYNQVIKAGFIGISFDGDNAVVKNNLIDSFSFVKDDGAAIYTHGVLNVRNKGRKVTGNIVLNGLGAPEGTTMATSSADGIYMDDNVNGVEVTGNTIANCNRGLYLHNCRNIVVKNNTSYNNNNGQLHMKKDWLGGSIRNQTITNNIFFSKLATQTVASIITVFDDKDISNWGKFDKNYYARPIDDKLVFFNTTFYSSSKEYRINRDLPGWKSKYGLDASSTGSDKKIAPYRKPSLIGANKFIDGSFNTRKTVGDIWANDCSITWGNAGLLDGGYLKVTPRAASSSIVLYVGALSSSKKYILKYSLKGSGNMSIGANLRSSDYNLLSPIQYRAVSSNRTENQLMFTPSANERGNGAVVFRVDAKSTYYLDNLQLYEAETTITNPDDSIRFVYNPTKVNKTVRLDGNYIDVKNIKYSNSITLAPYTSAVLIKNTETLSRNAAPSVKITNPGDNADYTTPASIKIAASATDEDGTVDKVELYNGTKLLGTKYDAPYTFTMNNVTQGRYTLTAKATDNDGNVTTSAGVSISVVPNKAPTVVRLINPDNNRVYIGPADIYIRALVVAPSAAIKRVDFYSGNRLIGTQTVYPYAIHKKNIGPGNYTVKAVAIDNNGRSTASETVKISVVPQTKSSVSSRPSTANSTSGSNSTIDKSNLSDNRASLTLSPNPVSATLNISTKGLQQNKPLTISVVAASGSVVKTIQSNTSNQTVQLDVSSLQNGVYFIKVICGDKLLVQQFVKL